MAYICRYLRRDKQPTQAISHEYQRAENMIRQLVQKETDFSNIKIAYIIRDNLLCAQTRLWNGKFGAVFKFPVIFSSTHPAVDQMMIENHLQFFPEHN